MSTPPTEGASDPYRREGNDGNSQAPAAGWYPTPTGDQRFWDGTRWLELPPPASPEPGMPANRIVQQPKRRVGKWIAIAGALVVLLGLAGGGIAWKVAHNDRIAAEEAEAAASEAAAEERERRERREDAAEAAQERRDDAERTSRRSSVSEIEASVKTMADGHVADGILDGPILQVSCSPVGGGSADDLTEQTTVFKCFAANKDNGDGTMSGFSYNATMNWSTGEYTYGLGSP